MPFIRAALTAALIVVTSTATFAGPPQPLAPAQLEAPQLKMIDAFIGSEMQRQQIPGVAVGIYSHGTVLLAKGYGLANVEHRVPVKPETIFQSGSVGKQFVAAAIMLLVEEGRVALDDPITKYFPEGPPDWRSIRVEHLLSHTSGLAEYETPERSGPQGPFYLRLDFTEDELVKKIGALPIEAAPAQKWDYRNTNYVLLGVLIHRVTGMPFGDYLAGMRTALSTVWPDPVMTLVERRPAVNGIQASLFRLVRGDWSLLVAVRLEASGLIDSLRITPDRDYQ